MHNKDDKIIYIGKAKDLYKRVSQYFLRPQVGKVAKMAFEAEYFETIITNNEKELLYQVYDLERLSGSIDFGNESHPNTLSKI